MCDGVVVTNKTYELAGGRCNCSVMVTGHVQSRLRAEIPKSWITPQTTIFIKQALKLIGRACVADDDFDSRVANGE